MGPADKLQTVAARILPLVGLARSKQDKGPLFGLTKVFWAQDEMMLAAARAVADFVTPEQIEQGQIYPEAKDLRACAATVRTQSMAEECPCWALCPILSFV